MEVITIGRQLGKDKVFYDDGNKRSLIKLI